ncbi:MAG: hypothetical protein ACXWPM_03555 [Bdellovibrionota bacterium]
MSGNRGLLWQGGFPYVDFKLHYWFDFHFAIDLNVTTASHFFNSTVSSDLGHTDVTLLHGGIDLRYYFDTKNAPAPISFSNPFLLLGGGVWSKTQNNAASGNPPDQDTGFGVGAGAGLQFALIQRKCYFEVEGKVNYAQFKDTGVATFKDMGIPDLSGLFFTITGNVLFTW